MKINQFKTGVLESINRDDVVIEITTTQQCNCHCTYCFEQASRQIIQPQISKKIIVKLIDYCNSFDITKHKHLVITFWGGEPFLNADLICEIVQATSKYDFVIWRAYSNGTMIDKYKQLAILLEEYRLASKFQIQLSYDGEPHHTIKRKYSSQFVIDAANYLVEHNVNISFKATLAFDMIDCLPQIWDSYKSLYQMFGDLVAYSPTLDMTNTSNTYLNAWIKNMTTIANKEYHFFLQNGRNLMSFFNGNQKRICDINNSISIDVDGTIYRCHGCFYEQNKNGLVIGNIDDMPINDALLLNVVDSNKIPYQCSICEAPYCAVCHAKYVNRLDVFHDWTNCMPTDTTRCQYFKEFARIFRAYRLAIHRVNR